ncbi:MAG: hypothetical protein IT209_09600 [Armatimonadetes bacterium]|nr:hypothetical protein [Armatimonadota bacterium]
MKAQEAIVEIVNIFDEGNKEIEAILAVHDMYSLKSGQLIELTEESMMRRVGRVVKLYEEEQAKISGQSGT